MDEKVLADSATLLKRFLCHPVSYFCLVLPWPLRTGALWLVGEDNPTAGMLEDILPWLLIGLPLLAAGAMLLARVLRRRVLPPVPTLWWTTLLALPFCLVADHRFMEFRYLTEADEFLVLCSNVLLTAGGIHLFWALLKKFSVLLWVPFLLLAMLQDVAYYEYGTLLNPLVVAETLETSKEEAMAYLTPSNIGCLAVALLLISGVCWLMCRAMRGAGRLSSAGAGALLAFAAVLLALPERVEDEDTQLYWPYMEAYRVILYTQEALNTNLETIECAKNLPSPAKEPSSLPTLKGGEGVVLVVHIGESVRADRMSINGYERDTTPWLRSQEGKGLINFPRCISCACDTCQAQIAILTDGRRATYDKTPGYQARCGSVLDLFRVNGFDLYCFRGARCAEKLKYDLVVHLLTRGPRRSFNAPRSPWTALPQMQEVLERDTDGRNMVFFINNEGSHTPFYHYDHDNPPFTPARDDFEMPTRNGAEINNAYDGTIHYTDEYVRRVVELLKVQGRPFVYVYVSDHGEYLGHDGIWGRGALGSSKMNYHDTDGCVVGMFVIHSPEFAALDAHFAEALERLAAHASLTVGHEHVFHTLLGLFGLETPHYNPQLDLCSPQVKPYDGPQPAMREAAPAAEGGQAGQGAQPS